MAISLALKPARADDIDENGWSSSQPPQDGRDFLAVINIAGHDRIVVGFHSRFDGCYMSGLHLGHRNQISPSKWQPLPRISEE